MKLYVTRHGQTAWNRENIVCGVTDLPLDETGMEQARETARKLKDTPIDRVIVSPLLRARQTAALICEGRDLPVMIDPRIKEQNYGVYEGASRFDEGFLNNKKSFAIRYPGGESQMSTAARVYAFLEDIAQKYPEESVLLVCHGGICRIIESYFHDMTNEAFFQFNAGNCQVLEYGLDLPQREREGSVTFYGSVICSGCREAKELFAQKGFTDFRFVEITASTDNLRAFLKLRDTREELREAREEGRIGIPCFVRADGSITLEAEDVLKEAGLPC